MRPIAIVGLSGLFPASDNVGAFWDNIVQKRSCITEVPESRWRLDDYYDADPSAPDKTYCRVGGFMPDIDFDPVEFGIPPNVLEVTDVAQLLALILARDAFADAGYVESSARQLPRERTGVILGIGGGQKLVTPLTSRLQWPVWEEAMRASGISAEDARAISAKARQAYVPWEENSFPGLLGNVIAGRIANRFDLGGINCVVDAACASSLAALRMAVSELNERQCDVMLTGGIDTDNTAFMYLCFSKTPAFSKQGVIRPFDAGSDGMLIGEAAGLLVLKRLDDAEREGDRIYAVIRGIGSSSDGRFNSIYAPRSEGQALALRRAYANAGFEPRTVTLIEAHGTGTVAGDLVEIGTLDRVFGREARAQIALGSAKSQVGHGKAAAGAVGLIKAALALHHKVLPPTINVSHPHPAGEFGRSAFYLNTETRPWFRPAPGTPRRAGVSSFGFGGSNYHAVLEEHEQEQTQPYRLHGHARPFMFAARTPAELTARMMNALELLEGGPAGFGPLSDESATRELAVEDARIGFVAGSAAEAGELLRLALRRLKQEPNAERWDHPRGIFFRKSGKDFHGQVVALFPGQGSQYTGMGQDLAANFPEVREAFARFDALLTGEGAGRLSAVVFPPPRFDATEAQGDEERLRGTDLAQPAIGALSAGMFRLLQRLGFEPDFACGHSFGELTALWAAGVVDEQTFGALACARGAAMAPPADGTFDPGAMVSVRASAEAVRPVLDELEGVSLANINAPGQVVLAGPSQAMRETERLLAQKGLAAARLPVAAAFHTPLVAHARDSFAAAVAKARLRPSTIPVFANATAQPYPKRKREVTQTLVEQMLAPVNFADEIEHLYQAGGRLFVEIGPRRILTDLVEDILGDRPHETAALNPSRRRSADRQFREALVKLRVLGLQVTLADPYRRVLPPPRRELSAAAVKLNGANYVSPQTRQAHRDALNNGHRAVLAGAEPPRQPAAGAPAEVMPTDGGDPSSLIGAQAAIAEAHQQFVRDQGEQNRLLLSLLRQVSQTNTALDGDLRGRFEALERLQAETQRTHHLFLEQQTELLRLLAAGQAPTVGTPPWPDQPPRPEVWPATSLPDSPADGPAATASASGMPASSPASAEAGARAAAAAGDTAAAAVRAPAPAGRDGGAAAEANIETALLELVSERTGYPLDVLDMSMDIEADLGIDSIKRVEILGALRDRFPDAPQPRPAELGELRTLASVAGYLAGGTAPAPVTGAQDRAAPEPPPARAPVTGVRLQALPPPDELDGCLPSHGTCLVTDDGTSRTAAVAGALQAAGVSVAVLELPPTIVPMPSGVAGVRRLSLAETREELLTGICRDISGLVYLHPRSPGDGLFPDREHEALKLVFLLAKHLAKPLSKAAASGDGRPFFCTATVLDGALGLSGDDRAGVLAGGLFGLVKSLRLECPGVHCRAIDLSPGLDDESAAQAILNELRDPNGGLAEVAAGVDTRGTLIPAL